MRHAAAVAAANAAKVFPGQAIEALTKAMGTAPPADWAVLAASLGPHQPARARPTFAAAEQAIAAGLPTAALRAQAVRPARPVARPTDPLRVEGAARGLEALVRVNGKSGTLAADTRVAALRRRRGTAGPDGARAGPSPAAGAAGPAQCDGRSTASWRSRPPRIPTTRCGAWR